MEMVKINLNIFFEVYFVECEVEMIVECLVSGG